MSSTAEQSILNPSDPSENRSFRALGTKDIDRIPQLEGLDGETRLAMKAVANVLPFRVNQYVIDELIDWSNIPNDPMYQLTFPQPGMLAPENLDRMIGLVAKDAPRMDIVRAAREIQRSLNPHPAGQFELNVPKLDGEVVPGVQHKYRETVLFFPASGQTCHAYCTYCFRWPQFVGLDGLKFASKQVESLVAYLKRHPEVSNVVITGGDPMIMKTSVLARTLEPLLSPELEHLDSIRIGSKAPAYWPQRFVTDADSDALMRLFERVGAAGKHLALMAHYSHPRELSTPIAERALARIQSTGATVRCQAPLIRHVNDSAKAWAELWGRQVQLGAIPYYLFVERDTGPRDYFSVPLVRSLEIFQDAYRSVSGLARTVRGPSMSATPGKVLVDGLLSVGGEDHIVLRFLQARNPEWVGRPFLARFDPEARWLDELVPSDGRSEFFFEAEMRAIEKGVPEAVAAS
ncbi:lysine 2,3-aminomutase [Myxococcota bacterium]|nr:lysine 2,3-aminomutase [Myxococcota bacterium]